ncbi:AraC family transcriptional regulator [Arcobacter roscoffensis]|uniref:Helix-turn-helix domain-containing protein n=1 Tax=Arcobacter roscoffensis TaxID=2961520 RepID=A0ABY5E0D2_9BACT|nr:helix-turn-helix domain-containing protein [Arcobacter roscoffensis]UTJ05656.1 helix-turn-helix domain-containing protein [Arcobacter roscoffensis]
MYKNIEYEITLDDLAKINHVSKFHFHRIFKEETSENFSEVLTSIRLQKAANLLISNQHSTITEISKQCGYNSHSSFIKAFKNRFLYTPSQWKNGSFEMYSEKLNTKKLKEIKTLDYEIKVNEEVYCAYIRHKGYDKTIKNTWQRLRALAYQNNIEKYEEIGLHHDNPAITPLDKCKYIAAITISKNQKIKSNISTFIIPKSLCAVFKLDGKFGEIIDLIRYIHQNWILNEGKGYEITTLPIYIKYIKNHLIDNTDFKIEVNIPIKVI